MDYKLIPPPLESRSALETVLKNRGLSDSEIIKFLNPSKEYVYSPFDLANIVDAAKTILKSLAAQEDIYIQVDSDCDGYTSSAALINYLYNIAPATVVNHIFYGLHDSKHHGIDMNNITSNIKLVIVPDASSNEIELHKELNDKGIKVVILDHHQFTVDSSDPAIIVNNQIANYPNHALSGVGVVYKLCQVFDTFMPASSRFADQELDLVALGMIADMMDLRSAETKYLIDIGLKEINNPFIRVMSKKNEFMMKGILSPFTISFYISPYVNAVTRVGSDAEKLLLFESMLKHKAYQLIPSTKRGCKGQEECLVDQAVRTCGTVKKHQEDRKTEYLDNIRQYINDYLIEDPILIVRLEQEIDTNLSGLLANQIMAEYHKPTLILHQEIEEETGEIFWTGSARAYQTALIKDWRQFIADSGYAIFAEGHPYAFGVAFYPAKINEFCQYLYSKLGNTMSLDTSYDVDFVFEMKDDFDLSILELARYKDIWGQGVAEPIIVLHKIPVSQDKIFYMGKGTLKIVVPNHPTNCIKFNYKEQDYKDLMSYFSNPNKINYVTIIGTCALNEWNGETSPQIMIKDFMFDGDPQWDF